MTAIKLDKFGGQLPAWDSRLLPDGQADVSLNCYLFSGALVGWRQPKKLYQLKNLDAKYAYRLPNAQSNNTSGASGGQYKRPAQTVVSTSADNSR